MYVIVDERQIVVDGYTSSFKREGICVMGVDPREFAEWLDSVSVTDAQAIDAFLIGDCENRQYIPGLIRERSDAPILCLRDSQSLGETLCLLTAGADDVLRKPVHPREIVARVCAINRRNREEEETGGVMVGELCIYFDGRDPEIRGETFPLPRRERRILEYIARNRGRRVTKSQIFNAVYGLFDESVDENVVESHVCKLRKKLKRHLGFDPIESQRYLGYLLAPGEKSPEPPKIHFEGALFFDTSRQKQVVGCKIADLTENSARVILTRDTLLPVERMALFESCGGNVYDCKIRWRKGYELGLELSGILYHELHKALMTRPTHSEQEGAGTTETGVKVIA
jgi:two-component system, OmpR family, flagellar system response regulator FtcR